MALLHECEPPPYWGSAFAQTSLHTSMMGAGVGVGMGMGADATKDARRVQLPRGSELELEMMPSKCHFFADSGLVCAMRATLVWPGDDEERRRGRPRIEPVDAASPAALRATIAEALRAEFDASDAFVQRFVQSIEFRGDALFCMSQEVGRADEATEAAAAASPPERARLMIGFVVVERDRFVPFISHLYVAPEHRRHGHAEALLAFAERYVASLGFSETKLWCRDALLPFYRARGWSVESRADALHCLLTKSLAV